MMRYNSMQELADKAESEGSWLELILGYGLDVDDLPPDAPIGLAFAIHRLNSAWRDVESYIGEYL